MLSKRSMRITIVLLAVLASACSTFEKQPVDIANSIELDYETGPQIKAEQYLTVWLINHSTNCVRFPPDFGIRIFLEGQTAGKEFPNLVVYIGEPSITLKPEGEILSERSVDIRPDLTGFALTGATDFYALVSGHLCEDESVMVEKRIPFTVVPGDDEPKPKDEPAG